MPNLIIVLDNVRSAFNVGSAFRTADGLGAQVHLIGITPVPGKDKKLDKTSLSSLEYVEWKYFDNPENWYHYVLLTQPLPEKTNLIFSVEESRNLDTVSLFAIKRLKYNKENIENIYLVFGHEINGVSKFIQDKSDSIISIPMYGTKNSLNVATCIGVVGYRIKEELI